MHTRRNTLASLLLLMLVLIPAWAPLTRPGLPQWQSGALPALHLGALAHDVAFDAGVVLDSFFSYTVARLFRLLGLNDVAALKASLALGMMLAGLAVFFWARQVWGNKAGVLAALLALYAPVFLSGVYILGGVALPWLMLGLALLGLAATLRGLARWLALVAGLALTAFNAVFLFQTPLSLTSIPFYRLFEFPWMWDTTSISLETDPAWTPGLPLLALALFSLWLSWSHADSKQSFGPNVKAVWLWAGVGVLLLAAALFVPGDLALVLILAASLALALVAAGVLALAPTLKTPAIWAALLILPVLAAGPALSPDFQAIDLPEQPAGVFGPQHILLIRAEMENPPAPGQTLVLQADWQATEPIDFDYNIFIHVVDDAGNLVAQLDTQPLGGERPMTTWQPGEIIHDTYRIDIPADAPSSLHVQLGLYNWQTLERLPLAAGGDTLAIGK